MKMIWDQQGTMSLLSTSVTTVGPLHFHCCEEKTLVKNARQYLEDLELRTSAHKKNSNQRADIMDTGRRDRGL